MNNKVHIKYIHEPSEFLHHLGSNTFKFKDKDEEEAKFYGKRSVIDLFKTIEHIYCRYFILYYETIKKPLCFIVLDSRNQLHFFVTNNLVPENSFAFIKRLKHLIKVYTNKRDVMFVATQDSYKEAVKLNKLLRMVPYKKMDNYTVWAIVKG